MFDGVPTSFLVRNGELKKCRRRHAVSGLPTCCRKCNNWISGD
nr:MAG TPA: protein of unknown function DUF4186 [Caudoviricetes sp.]